MSQKMEILSISDLMSSDIKYTAMKEALKRGARDIIDSDDIIIISDDVEAILYIACDDLEEFKTTEDEIEFNDYYSINTYNSDIRDYISQKYQQFNYCDDYYICIYPKKERIQVENSDFRKLDVSYFDIIRENYLKRKDEELRERLYTGHIFGLFIDDNLIGFIGIHKEREIGMLKVLDEYQGMNYEYDLEANLINYLIDNGMFIYTLISKDDENMLALQSQLGLRKADGLQYWLFIHETQKQD